MPHAAIISTHLLSPVAQGVRESITRTARRVWQGAILQRKTSFALVNDCTAGHCQQRRSTSFLCRSGADSQMAKQVWALDFDGVVCDSVGESSLSAWKAAAKLWPEVFDTSQAEEKKESILEGMRAVRPVVETGYENVVQVRCLLEGVTAADMLERWHDILPAYMQKWGLDRGELVHLFGSTRDEWIKEDFEGWLAPNRIYAGVADALRRALEQHEVYIVTTKQARFTEVLLRDMAKVPFPADRIFSQAESGRPKSEVLQQLQQEHPNTTYHFVEDKYSTLEKVLRTEGMDDWQLYLVDWGYSTPQERKQAADNPRISLIGSDKFGSLLSGVE